MKWIALAVLGISMSATAQLPYKNFRSPVPERKTEYYATTNLRGGVKLVIEAKFDTDFRCYNYPDMRPCGNVWIRKYVGTLTQADGKLVAFLPKDPADKILDRDLVPWVIFISKEAIEEDKQYLNTLTEFTDETGQHWTKK